MSTVTEGADMKKVADGKGAAHVIKVVAHHPAALVKDRPTPFIYALWHRNVRRP